MIPNRTCPPADRVRSGPGTGHAAGGCDSYGPGPCLEARSWLATTLLTRSKDLASSTGTNRPVMFMARLRHLE
ncbi:MAG: hypothetical protein ACLFT8_08080 [Desulfovermiculus sp.]